MVRIQLTHRLGMEVFVASIMLGGRVWRQTHHMSEAGARNWVRTELGRASREIQRAA